MNQTLSPAPAGIIARLGTMEIGLLGSLLCVAALILGFDLLVEEVMEGEAPAILAGVERGDSSAIQSC